MWWWRRKRRRGTFDLEVHVEVIVILGGVEVAARHVTKRHTKCAVAVAAQGIEVLRGFLLQSDECVVHEGK